MTGGSTDDIKQEIFEATPSTKTLFNEQHVLFHYTSTSVFLKILENSTIRLSHAFYMNDFSEFSWISKGVVRPLMEERQNTGNSDYWGLVLNLIYGGRPGTAPEPETGAVPSKPFQNMNSYVFSLSEDGDDLGQWRAYGSENGVSIGFSYLFLKTVADNFSGGAVQLGKCQYDISKAKITVNALLDKNFNPRPLKNDDAKRSVFDEVRDFLADLVRLAPFFKHPKFGSEQEWRLVIHPGNEGAGQSPIKFRAGRENIIPYIELKLTDYAGDANPILRVNLAPRQDEKWAIWSFENFCKKSEYFKTIEFDMSKIPYRQNV